MIVLAFALALVALAHLIGLPRRVWISALGCLWVGVLVAHLLLPPDSPIPAALGGSWKSWTTLGLCVGAVAGYRALLGSLRGRVRAKPAQTTGEAAFGGVELDRYARHIMLREIGGTGQRRLKAARVLVVGAGGLGSPALLYLAAAGIGTIGIVDDDEVSNANLQRQIIHVDARIGQSKVTSAEAAIHALNPFVTVRPILLRLTEGDAARLFPDYDVILDGSDNFATRHLVNAAAVEAGKPLVSAAITQWEGQISLFDPARGGPCYACLFPTAPTEGLAPTCAEAGVAGPLPGVLGAMMALETIKHLTGAGETLRGHLLIYDALYGDMRKIKIAQRPDCETCGGAKPA